MRDTGMVMQRWAPPDLLNTLPEEEFPVRGLKPQEGKPQIRGSTQNFGASGGQVRKTPGRAAI